MAKTYAEALTAAREALARHEGDELSRPAFSAGACVIALKDLLEALYATPTLGKQCVYRIEPMPMDDPGTVAEHMSGWHAAGWGFVGWYTAPGFSSVMPPQAILRRL